MSTDNLVISEKPVICKKCVDDVKMAFDFKSYLSLYGRTVDVTAVLPGRVIGASSRNSFDNNEL
ncbi:hypothetical protein NQ317_001927 [Molorchus minor]|uniref:ZAD domain-containing protein n=1 Tax=Molorchus minor TaxID=1323400 RepID=A0ABQ9JEA0_9CUCU|nr:hypothetical protein NQ317_001927 [Molorchus minor]